MHYIGYMNKKDDSSYKEHFKNDIDSIILRKCILKSDIAKLPPFLYSGEIRVIERPEDIDDALSLFNGYNIVGFDTETRPAFKKGEFYNVSLLQLGVDDVVCLFRLNKCGLSMSLCDFLASSHIKKIGVGIRDDQKFLQKLRRFKPQGFIELQDYVEDFGITDKSFMKLMAIIFGVKISKRQRITNWEAETLTESQKLYSSTDAFGAYAMYLRLNELKRSQL